MVPFVIAVAALAAGCQWFIGRGAGFSRDVTIDGSTIWTASWLAPDTDVYEVSLSDPVAAVFVDDALVQRLGAEDPRAVWIGSGWHRLRVTATSPSSLSAPPVRIGRAGHRLIDLAHAGVMPQPVLSPALHTAARMAAMIGWIMAAAGSVVLLVSAWRRQLPALRHWMAVRVWRGRREAVTRAATMTALALVMLYGAFLRFDAITLKYGPVSSPAWLHDLQASRARDSVLRPRSMTWDRVEGRYISDPYTYLIHAREMRHFYGASPREPIFPAATRAYLWLLGNQDVAVSFASATFSVLLIAATFLLGREAFSPGVGLVAAALAAVEYDLVTLGVSGWRDDAFACGVALSACAMLRYARTGSPAAALVAGFAGGLSCLVRITSLSFLVPGLGWLLFMARPPWRQRVTHVAAATGVMVLVIAPFLITCWQKYGDPLYSINVHADVYRAAAGEAVDAHKTAATYLLEKWRARPVEMLATFVHGMTAYPFTNKWIGFTRWTPWVGSLLAWLAVAGLVAWVATSSGRLLLVVLASSLLPYSMTWALGADWRFTEHAYPFFLVAASSAVWQVVHAARTAAVSSRALNRRRAVLALVWCGALALAVLATVRTLPTAVAREQLRRGDEVNFESRSAASGFIGRGWSRAIGGGNVISRVLLETQGTLHLTLPDVRAYELTLRMDPFPRRFIDAEAAQPAVDVSMNGRRLGTIALQWTPERVGAYTLTAPADVVRAGNNTLTVDAHARAAISVWYVRVRPLMQ
jgi:4-amino-4-deoxy-L-arabinose transferase-like glycosyltransferase